MPLLLGLAPSLPIPSSVLEIAAGILIGPAVLNWVGDDPVITVFAKLGVALLLFLAGLEIDFRKLRGRPLKLGMFGFGSLLIGLALLLPLGGTEVIINPLLLAIILSATSLGIVCPVLKDAGILDSHAGTFVVAACSVAEFGSIVVLSIFFSPSGTSGVLAIVNLGVLAIVVAAIAFLGSRQGKWRHRVDEVLLRLQDSSAQLRVRIAMLLMIALLVLSEGLGFDAILGSFLAGALLSAVTDPAREDEFGQVRHKLEGIGFGFFVPIFFVATGLSFPVDQLFSNWSTALRVPLFFAMLLIARAPCAGAAARPQPRRAGAVGAAAGDVVVVHRRRHPDRGGARELSRSTRRRSWLRGCSPCSASLRSRSGCSRKVPRDERGSEPDERAVEGM